MVRRTSTSLEFYGQPIWSTNLYVQIHVLAMHVVHIKETAISTFSLHILNTAQSKHLALIKTLKFASIYPVDHHITLQILESILRMTLSFHWTRFQPFLNLNACIGSQNSQRVLLESEKVQIVTREWLRMCKMVCNLIQILECNLDLRNEKGCPDEIQLFCSWKVFI